MAKISVFTWMVTGSMLLTGCAISFPEKNGMSLKLDSKKSVDQGLQSICDVNRSRAREQLLKRIQISKFRNVALRISKEITSDEIADLVRLEYSRKVQGDLAPEASRSRNQLIGEIYTGAILRAGFKNYSVETIPGTDLTYRIGLDAIMSANDLYASIVLGHILKEPAAEGQMAQVSLSASPDQSRYYVELYQIARYETQADGSNVPVYMSSSLFDAVAASVPHYCSQVETALNIKDFNTIVGLRAGDASQPTPSLALPAPAPSFVASLSH